MMAKVHIENGKARLLSSNSMESDANKYSPREGYASIDGEDENAKDTHCHDGLEKESRWDKSAVRKLSIALTLCFLFMVGEVVGGVLANSLAIMTDAAHLLTDVVSFVISLIAICISARPATKKMSFGWHRAEVIGAVVSVLMIWLITGVLVYMAVQRVISLDFEIEGGVMVITSAIGVAVNLILGLTLHQHGHTHGGMSHGHSHEKPDSPDGHSHDGHSHDAEAAIEGDDTAPLLKKKPPKKENINVRAAFIHVLGDLVNSFGVLIAALIIYFKPEYKIADPICTFIFSFLVLLTTIQILRDALNVLMEGAPSGVKYNDVRDVLLEVEGVKKIHNIRIWSLTISKIAVSAHLAIDSSTSTQQVLADAGRVLREQFGILESTLQIEEYEDAMSDCDRCQDPPH